MFLVDDYPLSHYPYPSIFINIHIRHILFVHVWCSRFQSPKIVSGSLSYFAAFPCSTAPRQAAKVICLCDLLLDGGAPKQKRKISVYLYPTNNDHATKHHENHTSNRMLSVALLVENRVTQWLSPALHLFQGYVQLWGYHCCVANAKWVKTFPSFKSMS